MQRESYAPGTPSWVDLESPGATLVFGPMDIDPHGAMFAVIQLPEGRGG